MGLSSSLSPVGISHRHASRKKRSTNRVRLHVEAPSDRGERLAGAIELDGSGCVFGRQRAELTVDSAALKNGRNRAVVHLVAVGQTTQAGPSLIGLDERDQFCFTQVSLDLPLCPRRLLQCQELHCGSNAQICLELPSSNERFERPRIRSTNSHSFCRTRALSHYHPMA